MVITDMELLDIKTPTNHEFHPIYRYSMFGDNINQIILRLVMIKYRQFTVGEWRSVLLVSMTNKWVNELYIAVCKCYPHVSTNMMLATDGLSKSMDVPMQLIVLCCM